MEQPKGRGNRGSRSRGKQEMRQPDPATLEKLKQEQGDLAVCMELFLVVSLQRLFE